MTYAERMLDYLWSISPDGATNREIADRLGIASHQTVYMLTQELLRKRLIQGQQRGREWVFFGIEELPLGPSPARVSGSQTAEASSTLNSAEFETLARRALSLRFGPDLSPAVVPGVRKRFDFVSPDRRIIGDAKFYSRVRGTALPPAKFATIAEYVWLQEKTGAPQTFLAFGNDREVPVRWLERYGNLVSGVTF